MGGAFLWRKRFSISDDAVRDGARMSLSAVSFAFLGLGHHF